MATTKYEIKNAAGEILETKSKRAQATERAQALAKELREVISVFTTAGTHVADFKARKQQVKTKQYTRTVELPEGTKVPEGFRVAYARGRKSVVILHDEPAPKGEAYSVFNLATRKFLKKKLPTTRAAGAFIRDEVEAPAKEQTPEPANA